MVAVEVVEADVVHRVGVIQEDVEETTAETETEGEIEDDHVAVHKNGRGFVCAMNCW